MSEAAALERLRSWIGKSREEVDSIAPGPVARLSATFDRDDPAPRPGDWIPYGWHWLYFLNATRQSDLGHDGHAKRGGFIPDIPLPRRMWAGGSFRFHRPLTVGATVTMRSSIADVAAKQGRSGSLVFLTIRHELIGTDGPCVTEDLNIVYRAAAVGPEPPPPPLAKPATPIWRREITPDPTLLFRFSALTFNGHRIHYDHPYTTREEGYPGLLVHGPLMALLMLDLIRRNGDAKLAAFSYRGHRPVFDTGKFAVEGAPTADGAGCTVWTTDSQGHPAMIGEAKFAR
ncbi:MAG: MaoC family dehydratase N-terminal domain-containing protein [Alphaproteobacteria bacterium]